MTTCEELELGIVGEGGIVVEEMENHHGGVRIRTHTESSHANYHEP